MPLPVLFLPCAPCLVLHPLTPNGASETTFHDKYIGPLLPLLAGADVNGALVALTVMNVDSSLQAHPMGQNMAGCFG